MEYFSEFFYGLVCFFFCDVFEVVASEVFCLVVLVVSHHWELAHSCADESH